MGKPTIDSESSITHFSHPHPLKILNHQSLQGLTRVPCSGCNLDASESDYGCRQCNYFLHKKCSKMPKQITHPFDQHVFSLLPKPKYPEGIFNCDGCGKQGDGFVYHCETCGNDLHILCASLPELLSHQSHPHRLTLTFSPPYPNKTFHCDLCKNPGSNHWLYRCDSCSFDVHLSCGTNTSGGSRTRSTLPTSVINGSMMPIGIGQPQAQVIGMPQMMNTMPPNTSTTAFTQHQAFTQQYSPAMQQALAQQQSFVQQQALAQQQAMMQQRQVMMQQQAIMQQQVMMQQQQPGNILMNSFVQGLAGGVAQGATGALLQGLVGGGGGNGGINWDGGMAFMGFGGNDASGYDGSFGGMDGGGGGGDGSY